MFWFKEKHKAVETNWPFFPLTPTKAAKNIDTYRKAMDFALSREDVWNIAITGLYGAGKSSFLRTYFKDDKGVLWISLASFLGGKKNASSTGNDEEGSGGIDSDEGEHRLELSILQQIFYKFKNASVPYSRLCKTTQIPCRWYVWRVIWAVVSVCCVFGVWQPDFLIQYVTSAQHIWIANHDKWIFWLSASGLLLAFIAAMSYALYWLKTHGISSVDVSGLGIEMSDKTDRSVLNRNIDEIIYHFESSSYNKVVFEDIDRFNDVDIFTKLREVNLLLNNAEQIPTDHKPIRFIYALKEELFQDKKDKVKFFDFVIPIVPVINASNSQKILRSYLVEKCGVKTISPRMHKLIKDVSPYISDLRLLKNVCNEFYTYQKMIPDCASEEELLGMIFFKNFFPKEFALMHREDGVMKIILEEKSRVQQEVVEVAMNAVKGLADEIVGIKEDEIQDVKRLEWLYYANVMRLASGGRPRMYYRNELIYAVDLIHYDDWFDALRDGELSSGGEVIKWADIEKATDPECSYEQHRKRIEGRYNDRVDEARAEIRILQEKIDTVRRSSVAELMREGHYKEDKVKDEILKSYESWQDKELFVVLLRNGYINEKYHYYISIFYEVEGGSSRSDYYFEVGVTRGKEVDWAVEIVKPNEVIENLDVQYFATSSIRNFSICTELLNGRYAEKADEFFKTLAQKDRRNYEFVNEYLRTLNDRSTVHKFFARLMGCNEKYFAELIDVSRGEVGWSRGFVERQLQLFIAWAMKQDESVTLSAEVREFIEETATMPQLLQENGITGVDSLTDFVAKFNLKFKKLDCVAAKETGFLGVVLTQKAYVFEHDLLRGILDAEGVDVIDFDKKNYSVICRHAAVSEYVDAGFSIYLNAVYLKLKEQQEDDVDNVAKVIGRDELKDDDKDVFLEKQQGESKIDNVRKLNTTKALVYAIKANWIVPTWANVFQVWDRRNEEGVSLFDFMGREENVVELAKERCPKAWDEVKELAKAIVESGALSEGAIKMLLLALPSGVIEGYVGAGATPTLVEELLRQRRVKYSTACYQNLYAANNDSHVVLAAMCHKEFCADREEDVTEEEDVRKILESKLLPKGAWASVVNVCENWIVKDADLIKCVARGIEPANYKEIKTNILDVCLEFIDTMSLQCKVIQRIGGETEEIRARLGKMDEPYKQFSLPRKRPLLEPWDGLTIFLTFLQDKRIVTKFEEEDGKIRVSTTGM